ncbi:hypothetical protein J7M23_03725 [Candidatus Sumerlaeota bacterium]|nr:hypothetical protein [Candidatus Sumerlaeota bacterium]
MLPNALVLACGSLISHSVAQPSRIILLAMVCGIKRGWAFCEKIIDWNKVERVAYGEGHHQKDGKALTESK